MILFSSHNVKSNIIWGLAMAFAFLVPLSQFLSVRVLLITCFLSILFSNGKVINLKHSWDMLVFLFVAMVGLFYTEDINSGLKILETSFSFLSIPILLNLIKPFDEVSLIKLLWAFVSGLFVACILCLAYATISFFQSSDPASFLFYRFTHVIDFQPTYFAYFLVFCITFCLYTLKYHKGRSRPNIIVFLALFFFVVLMLTGGRTSFISMLFVFSFFLLRVFLDQERVNAQINVVGIVVIMVITMFTTTGFEQGDRKLVLNDSWDRFELWKSAISANTNPLLGVGTGDTKTVLNEYFLSHKMERFALDSLNSHNQFIQIYLSNGILGLLVIILLLARPIYLSFVQGYTLGILVFFPFILYGVTEVFLGRYQGVVFFAFLHQAFTTYLESSKPMISLNNV